MFVFSTILRFLLQFLCFSGCCHEHEICLDVCLCVLALVFFVCIWPWHEGAGRFGQRGAGWCQLASGHMVQSHQIAITGRFWLYSDTLALTLTLSLLSLPPIPLPSLITPVSLSASACLYVVVVMLWNQFITHFKITWPIIVGVILNWFWTVPHKATDREQHPVRYAGGSQFQFHTSQSLFTSSWACFFSA